MEEALGADLEIIDKIEKRLEERVVPVGTIHFDSGILLVSYEGNFYMAADGQFYLIGKNFFDALVNIIYERQVIKINFKWISRHFYGKITNIAKSVNGPSQVGAIDYKYDPSGNRIGKIIWMYNHPGYNARLNWYVRDAQGNVMAVYQSHYKPDWTLDSLTLIEHHMYGSSRLGIINRNHNMDSLKAAPVAASLVGNTYLYQTQRGHKLFELSNHLGNVLVTISDRKNGVDSTADGNIDYYTADVVNANDYYPFGMLMPERKYSASDAYRYGFNGKENDNEVKGEGNQQDYGMRVYDPRIGKFLSVDPLFADYAMLSTYQFATNTPIQAIDLDGLECFKVTTNTIEDLLNPSTIGKYNGNKDFGPWLDLLNFRVPNSSLFEAQGRAGLRNASVQYIEDAHSDATNFDYYSVTITEMPTQYQTGPNTIRLFDDLRTNLNDFLPNKVNFVGYNSRERAEWEKLDPTSAVMSFDWYSGGILPTDDASVLTSKYFSSDESGAYWTFSTIYTPFGDWGHPISGTRQFGITKNVEGGVVTSYTFFTRGVDRLTTWADTQADAIIVSTPFLRQYSLETFRFLVLVYAILQG